MRTTRAVREGVTVEQSGVRARPFAEFQPPFLDLASGMRIESIAAACRRALVQFLEGVDRGWGQAAFEAWVAATRPLVGSAVSDEEWVGRALRGRYARTMRARRCRVEDAVFRGVLEEARARLIALLQAATPPTRDTTFAVAAIRKGFVVWACDGDGYEGWVPVDVPGMWPVERLLSLAAADYLTRPDDYERACAPPLALWHLARVPRSS